MFTEEEVRDIGGFKLGVGVHVEVMYGCPSYCYGNVGFSCDEHFKYNTLYFPPYSSDVKVNVLTHIATVKPSSKQFNKINKLKRKYKRIRSNFMDTMLRTRKVKLKLKEAYVIGG
ncbi:hypothetical protein L1987_64910 [Smallanthus sonchifolius]|uniref:Uncharacterized protein n=1 Tax=Smallanthus sonchifolius TaxID=185202 RepID=A0ACB9BSX1_9ASTR|nr:hypothetical protein L1987_64910 [Smallanthus sonchifolius]